MVDVLLTESELRFVLGCVGGHFPCGELFDLGDARGDMRDERERVASTSGLRNDSDKGLCGSAFGFIAQSGLDGQAGA